MWDGKFVLSISGNGECGKDTAAVHFQKVLGIGYNESTSSCVVDPWWAEIKDGLWSKHYKHRPKGCEDVVIEPDEYMDKKDFYDGRRLRRMDWVAYIEYFNWAYGGLGIGLYAKAVEDGNQILTGIRRTGQFKRCLEHIIDVSIWLHMPEKEDESQEYGPDLCDYTLNNDGDLDLLKSRCIELATTIKNKYML